ncbi:peptidase S9, prolyl oligopeptidase active site domain protein [Ochromonadaceae sp. CCMP2298]|nr:peptidase S9, prolyl oligopeptidase active site domain protein [Ochromonadaceae sp. CCMP2298]|mmetsp:Transcript_28188/g.62419  ORF Transcript_28188/g.62419 Transcript_28188/m.62419 type:complete len:630 (+) Transcript_28188:260-2149(+)
MSARQTAPYGTWCSQISASMIADTTISLAGPMVDGASLYWLESRPTEGGRVVVVSDRGGQHEDLTPPGFSVRSRVHEYGGGAALVVEGTIYFVNADQAIYRQPVGGPPVLLIGGATDRYADMTLYNGRLICVRERHMDGGGVDNALVAVSLDGSVQILDMAHDFVSSPRVSDGRLAWLSWDLPNMPWDGTSLWVADMDAPLSDPVLVAGGPAESVFQPEWHPDGRLLFVSDRSGWWNLHSWDGAKVSSILPLAAEFGRAQWMFGMRTYDILPCGAIVAAHSSRGLWQLAKIVDGRIEDIATPYTDISGVRVLGNDIVFIGSSARETQSLVVCNLETGTRVVQRASDTTYLDLSELSEPQSITFATTGGEAYGFYYPPKGRFVATPDEQPPLIVRGHGGPTGACSPSLSLAIQFWTSRGFAVLDVNYRGSTGFGRAYREALYGKWGIADVDDMVAGASYLVSRGLADPARLAIRGGSAGGYTALAALAFRDIFSAGASLYGIGDLMTLARDTHKFESRYLDRLVGPLPQAEDVYRARSPIHHLEGFNCPVIFLQGAEDAVVPPNQAEAMVAALDKKGIPVAYVLFDGEGHGFRRAENVCRALEAELEFYRRVFGFELGEKLSGLVIRNLP